MNGRPVFEGFLLNFSRPKTVCPTAENIATNEGHDVWSYFKDISSLQVACAHMKMVFHENVENDAKLNTNQRANERTNECSLVRS